MKIKDITDLSDNFKPIEVISKGKLSKEKTFDGKKLKKSLNNKAFIKETMSKLKKWKKYLKDRKMSRNSITKNKIKKF